MVIKVNDKELIQALIVDKFYGIYTRNYLDVIVSNAYKNVNYHTIIIDFDGVGKMNMAFGYDITNNIFKKLFSDFKNKPDMREVIIGRWFSGDEIALITTQNPNYVLGIFSECCYSSKLTFKVLLMTDEKIMDINVM